MMKKLKTQKGRKAEQNADSATIYSLSGSNNITSFSDLTLCLSSFCANY